MMGKKSIETNLRADVREMLAAIVESSDDAIISKTLQGRISSWNNGAEKLFGYTAEEAIGKPITMLIPPDRLHEEEHILRSIEGGSKVDHFTTVRRTRHGRLIDVSVTISPIRDSAGKVVGASKIARDITEVKRTLAELKAAKEAAEEASNAKDRFLSALSHELRTPLTPVLAAVHLIERTQSLSDELREQIGMIRRNVETEARLVDDLLDLTRISSGKIQLHFEAVDVHAVIHNAVSILQSEINQRRLTVTLALRASEHHVWGDPGRLQQILLNILSNAVKFTPEEGNIWLRSMNDDGLKIELADTGVGIEADVLPRLFDAFEQGEKTITRRFGGLGLGLAIAHSLVRMHSGSIAAHSQGRDRGATFTLRFATVAPARPTLPAAQLPQSHDLKGHRILLVEDHADTRQIMANLLGHLGFKVVTAGSVEEALRLADTEEIDVLVSDIGLPDGSGIDVMRHMSERHNVRGVAISGFGQDEDLRRSREAGFDMHLIKPVNVKTLHDVIRKVTS